MRAPAEWPAEAAILAEGTPRPVVCALASLLGPGHAGFPGYFFLLEELPEGGDVAVGTVPV